MNADGSDEQRLTDNAARDALPRWSPDGEKIVFQSDRDGSWDIYVMNADGSDQERLTFSDAGDEHGAWSPDGTKIVYISEREGRWELSLVMWRERGYRQP